MQLASVEYRFPEVTIPGGPVVGQTTRLLDAWSPSPLVLRAPTFCYASHAIRFQVEEGESHAPKSSGRLSKIVDLASRKKDVKRFGESDLVFDVRYDDNGNIAHILQNQIGVALIALEALGGNVSAEQVVFVVSQDIPQYAKDLYQLMQFRIEPTEAPVSGNLLTTAPRKLVLRALSGRWLRRRGEDLGLFGGTRFNGERTFLARRGRRSLVNHEEVEQVLSQRGYRTVFMERLGVQEQVQCVAESEFIFGMHGAALGYLLLRDEQNGELGVLYESFPCGYATNWCRAMCHQIDLPWVGVMGMADETISDIYSGPWRPREFESRNYRLDLDSLSGLLDGEGIPGFEIGIPRQDRTI